MGLYDSIEPTRVDHTEFYQTKALGKRMRYLKVGSPVEIVRQPLASDYVEGKVLEVRHDYSYAQEGDYTDYQFKATSLNYGDVLITVRNKVIVECDARRDTSLPLYDYLGYLVEGDMEQHD